MPFTFSHPAVILPFNYLSKRWISMTGLIIGSITPDFEYFIRMKVQSNYSHTWIGLLWFDIPLSFILVIIYQGIIRNTAIDHLPITLNQRFSNFKNTNKIRYSFEYVMILLVSILIGNISHLLWDGFTHPTGYFVINTPMLAKMVVIGRYHLAVYKIIQHASSIIGAVVICLTALNLSKRSQTIVANIGLFWLIVAITSVVTLSIRLLSGLTLHQYGNIVATIISGAFMGLIISSIVFAHPKSRQSL